MDIILELKNKFFQTFNEDIESLYFSPGRINLIGEHIDYNGGLVLPVTISLGLYAGVKRNNSSIVRIISYPFYDKEILELNLKKLEYDVPSFLVYLKGIILVLEKKYHISLRTGFDICIISTLPPSSGLSSSAALELLFIHIIDEYYHLSLKEKEKIEIAVEAEHEYAKVNCGIMDQASVELGKINKALLLNTSNLNYKYIPLNLDKETLVIINTNKPRALVNSKYNERREECKQALDILHSFNKKSNLCDYGLDELEKHKDSLTEVLYKRAHHVISENLRVKASVKALENNDYLTLGALLKESHLSLKNDYEVTGEELDLIYYSLINLPKVLGIRMTGAGFGGCLIAIFNTKDKEEISSIIKNVNEKYYSKTGLNLDYYIVKISCGTCKLVGDKNVN